jgi:hypothetical protein
MVNHASIFSIQGDEDFNRLALEIFAFQRVHCKVYKDFLGHLTFSEPGHYSEIPCLPIELFKMHEVTVHTGEPHPLHFKSSGTTGADRSNHFVWDQMLYECSFTHSYEQFIGDPTRHVILALLPNYLEQGQSSLVHMVHSLIQQSQHALSGFMLNELDEVRMRYEKALKGGRKVIVFGVSYALLDLAAKQFDLSEAIIIETGGMKGRRKEMSKQQLHRELKEGLGTDQIFSEYGMTELLSQAYAKSDLLFHTPAWMRVCIRQINDPLELEKEGRSGGINVIDLANLYSCSFVATSDLGRLSGDGFHLLGRFDHADIRGCNLMVE